MRSELRWALLIVGIMFVGALAWWERRRPRQLRGARASERAALRESAEAAARAPREPSLTLPPMRARDPLEPHQLPVVELDLPAVPVLGPAPLAPGARSTAALAPGSAPARGPGGAAAAGTQVLAAPAEGEALAAAATGPARSGAVPAGLPLESLPRLPPVTPPVVDWPPDERRRIVALRLVASQAERFAGRSLRQALAAEGFVLGRFAIFHKPDEEQRAVLSAAALTRPGTFDVETMDSQHYGGLSLFAVLPGPMSPPQAFEQLIVTARSLNERLCGELQDEQGSPLTPARIALLRERLSAGASA